MRHEPRFLSIICLSGFTGFKQWNIVLTLDDCCGFCRVCMKYIDAAMERLKTKQSLDERDLSLVERILAGESDPKTAYILALDLILVGIDTVSSVTLPLGQPVIQFTTAKGQFMSLSGELRKLSVSTICAGSKQRVKI